MAVSLTTKKRVLLTLKSDRQRRLRGGKSMRRSDFSGEFLCNVITPALAATHDLLSVSDPIDDIPRPKPRPRGANLAPAGG